MPVGGKRPGAGRKPGAAWRGVVPRPATIRAAARSRVREVLATASDPLAVLVAIANDKEVDVQVRVQAASAAAPFIFPRLSAAVVATVPAASKEQHAQIVARVMSRFERLAPAPLTIDAPAAPDQAAAATIDAETPAEAPCGKPL